MIDPDVERTAVTAFRKKRVMTVVQLADLLSCSIPTVRKRLRAWNAFTSYNRNGSYYTLPDVPRFDSRGLWKYTGIFFSRYGNFTRTVQHLIHTSPMGLDAGEIASLMGLSARSFVSALQRIPGVVREKYRGRFVYYSTDQVKGERQKQLRSEAVRQQPAELPADAEAIAILVDRMKHPDSTYRKTVQRLRRRGTSVEVAAIEALLSYHGIEKKTVDTGR